MDKTTIAVALVGGVVVLGAFALGYKFLYDHWEDIKTLAIVALVVGGGVTVAFGGLKIRAGR